MPTCAAGMGRGRFDAGRRPVAPLADDGGRSVLCSKMSVTLSPLLSFARFAPAGPARRPPTRRLPAQEAQTSLLPSTILRRFCTPTRRALPTTRVRPYYSRVSCACCCVRRSCAARARASPAFSVGAGHAEAAICPVSASTPEPRPLSPRVDRLTVGRATSGMTGASRHLARHFGSGQLSSAARAA